jgi:hypothetical protein
MTKVWAQDLLEPGALSPRRVREALATIAVF